MKKQILIFLFALFLITGCSAQEENNNEAGTENKTPKNQMTEVEAKGIAEASCIKGGQALGTGIYNENSKTWSFEANLNATRPGCSAACIVSEENKTAVINWQCTGALQ